MQGMMKAGLMKKEKIQITPIIIRLEDEGKVFVISICNLEKGNIYNLNYLVLREGLLDLVVGIEGLNKQPLLLQ